MTEVTNHRAGKNPPVIVSTHSVYVGDVVVTFVQSAFLKSRLWLPDNQ